MNQPPEFDHSRRDLLKSAAVVPLAAILADPVLAQAVAAGLETVTITSEGGRSISASLALPEILPAPGIVVIHEWWGLNDHIKSMAAELAKEGYAALAIDLHRNQVATTPDKAMEYLRAVPEEERSDVAASWANWLRKDIRTTDRLGTVGWCFGGGWSLNTSLLTPVDATVIYYGNVIKTAEQVASLKGDVLGHFGEKDPRINREMVGGFEKAMDEAGKTYTNHWYDADHGFSNPSAGVYDQEDAQIAWQRTLDFFSEKLGES